LLVDQFGNEVWVTQALELLDFTITWPFKQLLARIVTKLKYAA